jgi:competence protein ComEC
MTLTRTEAGYSIAANQPRGVDRPWSPAIGNDQDGESRALASRTITTTPSTPVDATPSNADLQAED